MYIHIYTHTYIYVTYRRLRGGIHKVLRDARAYHAGHFGFGTNLRIILNVSLDLCCSVLFLQLFAAHLPSWAALGLLLAALGLLLAALGRSWAALGRSWLLLSRSWPL